MTTRAACPTDAVVVVTGARRAGRPGRRPAAAHRGASVVGADATTRRLAELRRVAGGRRRPLHRRGRRPRGRSSTRAWAAELAATAGRRRRPPGRWLARRLGRSPTTPSTTGWSCTPAGPHAAERLARVPRRAGRVAAQPLRDRLRDRGGRADRGRGGYAAAKAAAEAWTLALADSFRRLQPVARTTRSRSRGSDRAGREGAGQRRDARRQARRHVRRLHRRRRPGRLRSPGCGTPTPRT